MHQLFLSRLPSSLQPEGGILIGGLIQTRENHLYKCLDKPGEDSGRGPGDHRRTRDQATKHEGKFFSINHEIIRMKIQDHRQGNVGNVSSKRGIFDTEIVVRAFARLLQELLEKTAP